jgi:hypothetical protein
MANFETPYFIPPLIGSDFMNSVTSSLITTAAQYIGLCFNVPKSGTITKIGFLVANGGLTGVVSCGIYTVDVNGVPTGTAYGGMAPQTVTNPAADTAYTVTLATPATVTINDMVCVKMTLSSVSAGDFRVRYHPPAYIDMTNGIPYVYNSRTASFSYGAPVFWYEYSDGTYVPVQNTRAEIARTNIDFTNTTNPDEYGNTFKLPISCSVRGIWSYWNSANAPSSANGQLFRLYDANRNVLASTILDTMHYLVTANGLYCLYFSSPVSLKANTKYFITLYCGSNVSTKTWFSHTYPSNACMDVSWNKKFTMVSSVDNGSFDESQTTKAMPIGLIVDGYFSQNTNLGFNGGLNG